MKKKKSKFRKFLSISLKVTAILVFAGILAFAAVFVPALNTKLDTEKLNAHSAAVEIFDSNSLKLDTAAALDSSIYVNVEDLHPYTSNAFVAIEDKRFFKHNGIDVRRMGSAVLENVKSMSYKEGASTITQQLVKNTHLTNEKNINRKAKEIALAIKMEKLYSKQEILEMYLNSIYFGNNAYGIGQAAKCYFNKTAEELTLSESAVLAAIIKAPSLYAPDKNAEKCLSRRNLILKTMAEQELITEEEFLSASKEEISLSKINLSTQKMQGYENAVIVQTAEILGLNATQVKNSDLKIYTYLDAEKQALLESELLKDNSKTVSGKSSCKIGLVADNFSGGINAFCGNSPLNLYSLRRQAGSTAKPLAVYAPAFEENLISPASPVLDEITDFDGYVPQNASGTYAGWTTVRESLKSSRNVPAVKIFNSLNRPKLIKALKELKFLEEESQIKMSMALGAFDDGIDISNLTAAYMCLANGGLHKELSFIKNITDSKGRTLYSHNATEKRVFRDDAAYLTTDILKDVATTGTARALAELKLPVAGKTGTVGQLGNRNNSDALFCAYTSKDTMAVWVFSDYDDLLEEGISGGSAPVTITKGILRGLYPDGVDDFQMPDTVKRVAIDKVLLNNEHKIELAQEFAPESEKLFEYFSANNLPRTMSKRITVTQLEELNKGNLIDESIHWRDGEQSENPKEDNPIDESILSREEEKPANPGSNKSLGKSKEKPKTGTDKNKKDKDKKTNEPDDGLFDEFYDLFSRKAKKQTTSNAV